MKIKKILAMIEVLAVTSMLSVGFSSWTFVNNPEPETIVADVTTEDVFHVNDFFTLDKMEMFEFSNHGLFYDETIDFVGDLKISFSLQIKDGLYKFLTDKTSLSLNLILTNTGSFDMLTSNYLGGNTPSINYGVYTDKYGTTYPNSINGTLNTSQITSIINYSNDSLSTIDKLYFTVVYHFDFSSYSANFKEEIYDKISDDGIGLNFKIGVNF